MGDRLFPRDATDYRGQPVALWLFVPLTALTLGRSLVHVFATDGGAQTIATIPLDAMTPNGRSAVVLLFALWGLSQLLIGVVYIAVLCRYRALLPLMYVLVILEYTGRAALGAWKPMVTLETPPGATANLILLAAGTVLLVLSLWPGRAARAGRGTDRPA